MAPGPAEWLSLILVTALLAALLRFFSRRPSPCGGKLPPSPPALPFVGNAHRLLGSPSPPHQALRALSQEYGPLMLLQLGQVPTLVVSSAEAAEDVMKAQDLAFASRPRSRVAAALTPGGRGLANAPYGEYWRQAKKICVVHLLSARRVQAFRSAREGEVARLVSEVAGQSSGGTAAVDMSEILPRFTNSVICRAALGRSATEEEGQYELTDLIAQSFHVTGAFRAETYFPSLAWLGKLTGLDAKVAALAERWRATLDRFQEEAGGRRKSDEAGGAAGGFLDVLLALREEDDSTRDVLSGDGIKSLALTMIVAATDTSYLVLEAALEELIRNPSAMKKAQEEVRGTTVRGKPAVDDDDVSRMTYLKAVLKEAIRLHPPLPLLIPRESMTAARVRGYHIPAKTSVVVNAWAIGRDPAYWDSPEEFRPERFLRDGAVDFKGNDFQFIPFGAGRRICPGILFGMATVELALASLLYHFDWSLPEGMKTEMLDGGVDDVGLAARKKRRLLLVAKPRRALDL